MNEFPEGHVKVPSWEFVHFAHFQKLLACRGLLKQKALSCRGIKAEMKGTEAQCWKFILVEEDSHFYKVASNKFVLVRVQSPTKINAPRGHTLSSGQWFCADRNEV